MQSSVALQSRSVKRVYLGFPNNTHLAAAGFAKLMNLSAS